MYKNQLQELAQRSCFSLPWYTSLREGPDHAPRFKAVVNFNGETFESPNFCSTLRQAEHTAAEAALKSLSSTHSIATARILDETGVYKNLLQEIAQRVGSPLPQYTTFRSGSGHFPVFTGTVELAGITFTGEPAKNKKQAEKNAALAAWLSLKQLAKQDANSSSEPENNDEQEHVTIARALLNYRLKEQIDSSRQNHVQIPFQQKFSIPAPRPSSPQRPTISSSKILPFLYQKTAPRNIHQPLVNDNHATLSQPLSSSRPPSPDVRPTHAQRYPASTYIPIRQCRSPYQNIAPPVTLRTSVPVFSAPPRPPTSVRPVQVMQAQAARIAPPPVTLRTSVPVFSAPPRQPTSARPVQVMQAQPVRIAPPVRIRQAAPALLTPPGLKGNQPSLSAVCAPSQKLLHETEKSATSDECDVDESIAVKCLEQLDI